VVVSGTPEKRLVAAPEETLVAHVLVGHLGGPLLVRDLGKLLHVLDVVHLTGVHVVGAGSEQRDARDGDVAPERGGASRMLLGVLLEALEGLGLLGVRREIEVVVVARENAARLGSTTQHFLLVVVRCLTSDWIGLANDPCRYRGVGRKRLGALAQRLRRASVG